MKATGLVIAVLFAGLFASASPTAELPNKKITVEIKKAGVRDALEALFENSGSKFSLAEEITNDQKIDIEATKTKWSDVFSKVLTQAGLTYRMADDGTVEVSSQAAAEPTLEPDGDKEPAKTEE